MEVLWIGANMRGAECPWADVLGIVRTTYGTADGAGLPVVSQGRFEEPVRCWLYDDNDDRNWKEPV